MKPVPDSLPQNHGGFSVRIRERQLRRDTAWRSCGEIPNEISRGRRVTGGLGQPDGPFSRERCHHLGWRRNAGRIWVAHPLAERAERVTITNTENGRSIDAAMFHRDSAITGPAIVISSAAARALELTPGVPTGIAIAAIGPAPEPRETLPPANAVPARPQPVTGGIETAPAAPLKTLNEPAPAEPVAPAPEVPKPAESAPAPASKPKAAPQPAAPAVQIPPPGTGRHLASDWQFRG